MFISRFFLLLYILSHYHYIIPDFIGILLISFFRIYSLVPYSFFIYIFIYLYNLYLYKYLLLQVYFCI